MRPRSALAPLAAALWVSCTNPSPPAADEPLATGKLCVPGALRCRSTEDRVVCNAEGSAEESASCPAEQPLCIGEATCVRCAPGERRCGASDVEQCDSTGDWQLETACAIGCQASTCIRAVAIAGGEAFHCAALDNGSVRCWGANNFGQLGNAAAGTAGSRTPVSVDGITTATQVVAGLRHACALLEDGTVRCWGDHSCGQLGDGATATGSVAAVEVRRADATPLAGVTRLYRTSFKTTYARTGSGEILYWGGTHQAGATGGNLCTAGNFVNVATPFVSLAGETIDEASDALGSGSVFGCARLGGGTKIMCWGDDSAGYLGNGPTSPGGMTAVRATLAGPIEALAIGDVHACAISQGGTQVHCWGSEELGELGDGGALTSTALAPVALAPTALTHVGLGLGFRHSCLLSQSDGTRTLSCWGRNSAHESGFVDSTQHPAIPVTTLASTSATALSAGWTHNCVILASGSVGCFGNNEDGQLGVGTVTQSNPALSEVKWR